MPEHEALWQRVRLARHGSAVERAHAFPHLMRYSVGHHTLDMIMLIILCWAHDHDGEMPSSKLLVRAAVHDLAEGVTGDIPSPIKSLLGKDALEAAESALESHLLGEAMTTWGLSEEESTYLHWADRLELFLWVMEEISRGNGMFSSWVEGCHKEIREGAPESMRELGHRALNHRLLAGEFLSWEHLRGVAGI